jgi:HlyD family secretion protein
MLKKKLVWLVTAVLLVVVAWLVMAARARGNKGVEVQTAKVTRQEIVQKVSATGRIQPRTQIKISADVSAKIKRLGVVEGQHVDKGALLVELDRERYLAAVESAEANVRSAQANATLAHQNFTQAEREFTRAKGCSSSISSRRRSSTPSRPRGRSRRRATSRRSSRSSRRARR